MSFASFKNARIVRSGWLEEGGRRLDCNPYMSGALEARDKLKALSAPKESLISLTRGFAGGIYNGPVFARSWVDDPRYGAPFLGSSDMLHADLSALPLLKRSYAETPKLSYLELKEGMTLISCSGTIGRMAYVRSDMSGMWSSQHIMKVVPDPTRIPPGYLYAFLSSRYGVPLVVSGTYGAIIQHIEPEHIADLPVPRFSADIERSIHALVTEAAAKRDGASRCLRQAMSELLVATKLPELRCCASTVPFSVSSITSSVLQERCDGFFHSKYHSDVVSAIRFCGLPVTSVKQMAIGVQEPNRFKRVVLDAVSGGIPLFGTSTIFWNDPEPSYYLPRRLAAPCIVRRNTLLIPRSGQLQGVIGRPVLPYGDIIGGAVSEDAIRINCHTEIDAGFLFVFLSSEYGLRQLKARAFGSSIPHLDVRQIGACVLPTLSPIQVERIGSLGLRVSELRSDALLLEREAKQEVGRAIERDD
jgi:type I restriction enzyme S subunit